MRFIAPIVIAVLAVLIGAILYLLRYEEVVPELGPAISASAPHIPQKDYAASGSHEPFEAQAFSTALAAMEKKHASSSEQRFASANEEMRYYISEVLALRIPEDSSLDDALTALHKNEPKSESWATPLESVIHEAVEGMNDVVIKKLDCRTSLCKFEMELTDPKDRVPLTQHKSFMRAFMQAKGNNVITYGRMNLFSTQWTGFLLNLDQTGPYIEKFRAHASKIQRSHNETPY